MRQGLAAGQLAPAFLGCVRFGARHAKFNSVAVLNLGCDWARLHNAAVFGSPGLKLRQLPTTALPAWLPPDAIPML
jgi:hypothetical protein